MRVCVSRVAAMLHDLYGGRTLFCMKTPTKLIVFVCVVCCLLWLLSIRRNGVCCASETGFLGDDSFTAAACMPVQCLPCFVVLLLCFAVLPRRLAQVAMMMMMSVVICSVVDNCCSLPLFRCLSLCILMFYLYFSVFLIFVFTIFLCVTTFIASFFRFLFLCYLPPWFIPFYPLLLNPVRVFDLRVCSILLRRSSSFARCRSSVAAGTTPCVRSSRSDSCKCSPPSARVFGPVASARTAPPLL